MTISYQFGQGLYLNITNKCNCSCVFCIRSKMDGLGDSDNLWLDHEPGLDEVIADLKKRDLSSFSEIVFCGYGEPTESLDVLIETGKYIKRTAPQVPVRLNTNGLCGLSLGKAVAPLLKGVIDTVSISLNAPDAKRYAEITNPCFGEKAFAAMQDFADECKKYIPEVVFSVVDVLSKDEIARCRQIARAHDIPLRVREEA